MACFILFISFNLFSFFLLLRYSISGIKLEDSTKEHRDNPLVTAVGKHQHAGTYKRKST